MLKRRTQSMQRYHKVHEIGVQPVARRTRDDLLPDLGRMTLLECEEERTRLLREKSRAEQELISAKHRGDLPGIQTLGLRIQSFSNRLGQVNRRMKAMRHAAETDALKQAITEVLDQETWLRIIDRKEAIRRAMLAGEGA